MNVFEEMDSIVHHGSQLHCYFVGVSLAGPTPGKFASVHDVNGHAVCTAQGAGSEDALRNLILKLRAPKRRTMPGL